MNRSPRQDPDRERDLPESDEECVDAAACTAECIREVDCEDITAPRPDSMYTNCVNGCAREFEGKAEQ